MALGAYLQEVRVDDDREPRRTTSISTEDDEDANLLKRICDGDERAYEQLFRRYYPRLNQFAVRVVGQHDLAEEVVDDTLLVVWRKARSFQGRSKVSTWIYGIAHRLARKALSKQHRRGLQTSQDAYFETLATDAPSADPERASADANRWAKTEHAIAHLSYDHQTTVYFVANGLSYPEIAAIMGCPENTVKTRMFHARTQLRNRLQRAERNPQATSRGV